MTKQFLEKIQPYILSEDPHVQDFALRVIHDGHLGDDDTFLLALEANDRNEPKALFNNIIPRTSNIRIGEKGFRALLERIKRNDDNYDWYKTRVLESSAVLFHQFRSELEPLFTPEIVNVYAQLPTHSEEELFQKLDTISYALEQEYDDTMFEYGKKVIENLVHRELLSNVEIAETVREFIDEEEYDFKGLLYLYAAGIAKCTEVIPVIAPLLRNDYEDDFISELAFTTMKQIGTDEVVQHVAPLMKDSFHAIGVLEVIKTRKAEEALLTGFDQLTGKMIKTSIAESLCFLLSKEAIPKVEHLIETGYEKQMTLLEEALYPNCVINNIDHPKLDEWKAFLDQENSPEKQEQMHKEIFEMFQESTPAQPTKSTKVGRNEPCPCGSGKKYKKCCGK